MRYFDFLDDAQLATVHGVSPEFKICHVFPEPRKAAKRAPDAVCDAI